MFFQNSCASASCIKLAEEDCSSLVWGIPIIGLDDIKKPEHKHTFSGPFFAFIDGMWGGSLVTVKHAPEFSQDEFFHFGLRKEINLLRQLRHFRFPVAMAICLDPFCLIMERFYHSTLSMYLRDPSMDMEKDLECHLMRIIRIMLDIAQALSHLHRRNWIHCHVSSHSTLVCDGPRAKLGSLEFCERPGAAVEFMECFQDELPWLAPELLAVGEARFPADIYSFAATFWECLTRTAPWSWLSEEQIPESRLLPILLCWPNLVKHLLSQCMDEVDRRPTADTVCRKLGEFMRLGLWLDRYKLDEMFKRWLEDHCVKPKQSLCRSHRSSVSSRSDIVTIALGEKYSSLVDSRESAAQVMFRERANRRRSIVAEPGKPQFRRRSAIVTSLVEEALTSLALVGVPASDVHEADIYKFGFKLAREIAELRAICAVALQKRRKAWAKVALATRDLEEDMFDSLAGYEEVTFRRKHAHAANLKKHHQEKEEEKLKESLERKKSLIKRHKRKNWACYTMLLCELYGILRRRDTVCDEGEEDYEQEVLNQSISRISSQMRKLSSIIVGGVSEDGCSGKFSSYPINVAKLTRHSNDSVLESSETVANVYEHGVTDKEVVPSDPEVVTTDPDVVATNPEVAPTDTSVQDRDVVPPSTEVTTADPEVGTTGADNNMATGVDNQPMNHNIISSSPDGSTTFLEDLPVESKANTSTPRVKNKTSKIRSFFKRKTKKDQRKDRYMESAV